MPVLPVARYPGFLPWCPSVSGCKLLSQCVQLSASVSPFHLPRKFPSFLLSCLIKTEFGRLMLGMPLKERNVDGRQGSKRECEFWF